MSDTVTFIAKVSDNNGNPLIGQQTMVNSLPFVFASDQSPLPVTGTFFQATQPISGNVGILAGTTEIGNVKNSGTFAVQATQSGTWNIGTVTTVTAITAITNALPIGANTIGGVNLPQYTPVSGRLPVDGSAVTQPVSIAGTINENMTGVNGVAPSVNTGTMDAGTQRVAVATDNTVKTQDEGTVRRITEQIYLQDFVTYMTSLSGSYGYELR